MMLVLGTFATGQAWSVGNGVLTIVATGDIGSFATGQAAA